jgi:ribosomal protein S27AE
LDEAFRRAEEAEESFIVHSFHAEEVENPKWIKMGQDEERNDAFGLPKWVCGKCRFTFEKANRPGVSTGEVFGYLLIVPGILKTRKRKSRSSGRCPHCGSPHLVEGKSKAGRVLLS